MSDGKMPDLGGLMDLAKKLQGDVTRMQQELERRTCEASAGGGMVTAVVNGKYELVSLRIEKDVVDPAEVGMLQDLVVAAPDESALGFAQPDRVFRQRLENRLKVKCSSPDHLEQLAGRRLLLERHPELAVTRFELPEQPHVLDRDDSLVGEGLHQRNLTIAEWTDLEPVDGDHPQQLLPP